MLKLGDFFHLPQVDELIGQLVADRQGLVVVAGLDPRPVSATAVAGGFLPSGRSSLFRILMREILDAHPSLKATVVAEEKAAVRIFPGICNAVSICLWCILPIAMPVA